MTVATSFCQNSNLCKPKTMNFFYKGFAYLVYIPCFIFGEIFPIDIQLTIASPTMLENISGSSRWRSNTATYKGDNSYAELFTRYFLNTTHNCDASMNDMLLNIRCSFYQRIKCINLL